VLYAECRAVNVIWPPCIADADIIFSSCGFFLFFFSSPNLTRRRLDAHHTSAYDVALVRIWNVYLKCAACGSLKYRTQKSPSGRHRTTLSGYIFATKASIDNRKKNPVKQLYLLHVTQNMVNFGRLPAEICWRVCGTPANFNRFRVLASLLHRHRSKDVNITLHDAWPSPGTVYTFLRALAP